MGAPTYYKFAAGTPDQCPVTGGSSPILHVASTPVANSYVAASGPLSGVLLLRKEGMHAILLRPECDGRADRLV